MNIYKNIYPTRWPLLELYFGVYNLKIVIELMRPATERLAYEYVVLHVSWGGKELLKFFLYESEQRMRSRLDGMLTNDVDYTVKQLKEIRKVALEEIRKIKKLKIK